MSDWKEFVPNDNGPLHVYRGGNFTKIAGEGYREHVKEHHYLSGAVASMDDHEAGLGHVTSHEDGTRPVRNAERLVACWNAFVGIPTEEIEQLVASRHISSGLYYLTKKEHP